ncbi:MAG: diguanylate cyclase [Lachnospiraceae bacterium]|nr:diguanylate cyclase [Lachnospiraceae bacterium]
MKNSLKKKFIRITIASFSVMVIVVCLVAYTIVYSSMANQEKEVMKSLVSMVVGDYDETYPGEYGIKLNEDGTFNVYKGKSDISRTHDKMDEIKEDFDYDMSIFCKNIRVITSFDDENGEPLIGTKAATKVDVDVVEGGESCFYNNVKIGSKTYFAYYEPIILEDGTIYGMVGICCPAAPVQQSAFHVIIPLTFICIIMALFFCWVSIRFSNDILNRANALGKFMRSVADGNFLTPVDAVLNADDELGEITKDAKRMQRNIQVLVEIDTLTKLNNRRYGNNRLKLMIKKSQESNRSFCVCIGDIDFFKKVNDTYGHDAGDEVLKAVSKVLKEKMKGKGFVARWGGEEFLIVFEMMDLDDAVKSLNDILNQIRKLKVECNGNVITMTMSFGVIQGEPEFSGDELLKKADDNLYYAKSHGRNQVYSGRE